MLDDLVEVKELKTTTKGRVNEHDDHSFYHTQFGNANLFRALTSEGLRIASKQSTKDRVWRKDPVFPNIDNVGSFGDVAWYRVTTSNGNRGWVVKKPSDNGLITLHYDTQFDYIDDLFLLQGKPAFNGSDESAKLWHMVIDGQVGNGYSSILHTTLIDDKIAFITSLESKGQERWRIVFDGVDGPVHEGLRLQALTFARESGYQGDHKPTPIYVIKSDGAKPLLWN